MGRSLPQTGPVLPYTQVGDEGRPIPDLVCMPSRPWQLQSSNEPPARRDGIELSRETAEQIRKEITRCSIRMDGSVAKIIIKMAFRPISRSTAERINEAQAGDLARVLGLNSADFADSASWK